MPGVGVDGVAAADSLGEVVDLAMLLKAEPVGLGNEGVVAKVVGATDVIQPREAAVVSGDGPEEEVEHVCAAPVPGVRPGEA